MRVLEFSHGILMIEIAIIGKSRIQLRNVVGEFLNYVSKSSVKGGLRGLVDRLDTSDLLISKSGELSFPGALRQFAVVLTQESEQQIK